MSTINAYLSKSKYLFKTWWSFKSIFLFISQSNPSTDNSDLKCDPSTAPRSNCSCIIDVACSVVSNKFLFETSFLSPFFYTYIIFLKINGIEHFKIDDNYSHFFLIGAGIVTIIPLFFFNLGVKKIH